MRLTRLTRITLTLLALCGTLSGAAIAAGRRGDDPYRCLTLADIGLRRAAVFDTTTGAGTVDTRVLHYPYPLRNTSTDGQSYSPDGRYQTVALDTQSPATFVLLKSGQAPFVLHPEAFRVLSGLWAPDSQHFAYLATEQTGVVLKMVNVATRRIARFDLAVDEAALLTSIDRKLLWSSDSSSFAFLYRAAQPAQVHIIRYSTHRDQFRADMLPAPVGFLQVSWSPDNAHLALAAIEGYRPSKLYILNESGLLHTFEMPRLIQYPLTPGETPLFQWLNAERLILNAIDAESKAFEVYGTDGSAVVFRHDAYYVDYWHATLDGGRKIVLEVAKTPDEWPDPERVGSLIELDTQTGEQRILLDSILMLHGREANRRYDGPFAQPRESTRPILLFVQRTGAGLSIVLTDRAGRLLHRLPTAALPEPWNFWSDNDERLMILASVPDGVQRFVFRADGTLLHTSIAPEQASEGTRWLRDGRRLVFLGQNGGRNYADLIDAEANTVRRLVETEAKVGLIDNTNGTVYLVLADAEHVRNVHILPDGTPATLSDVADKQHPRIAPSGQAALLVEDFARQSNRVLLHTAAGDRLVWEYPEFLRWMTWSPESRRFAIVSISRPNAFGVQPVRVRIYRADGALIREGALIRQRAIFSSHWSDCSIREGE